MKHYLVRIEGRESRNIWATSQEEAIQELVENNIIDPEKERFSLEEIKG